MNDRDNSDFWESRYQEGTTRWDLGGATPPLASFLASPEAPKPGKTAVLGCGRGYDTILFARHGFAAIGFDFAPSAIAAATSLAKQQQVPAQFLLGDIFALPKEFPGYFDYVVEHTCFCAISPEKRLEYLEVVSSILKPEGELIGVFFTHNRPGGPPFGSTVQEIKELFATKFEILTLKPVTNSVPSRQGEEHLGHFRVK
ncbi:MAG: methyltransferase domain-containing protein [Oscillatoria sp. PMC 1051.18]|nr:methyltransferase domain-containing protein [Oscillatoria sp. PMC 1050.18]MEC5031339.1 methyltransferase domain-containing protein [Oscillatoria sp. PMC 1051.18]